TLYGRVTPYNGVLVSGAVSGLAGNPQQDSEFVPASEGGIQPPAARIGPASATASARTSATLRYTGTLGAGGAAPLRWRRRVSVGDVDAVWPATWNAVALPGTTFTATETVARDPADLTSVELEVQDAAGRSALAGFRLSPALPAIGTGGGIRRDVALDGVARRLMDVDDDAVLGREGRRRVDTFYAADSRLAGGVTVQDGAYTPRGLLDVARRAQGGLNEFDPAANSGGDIARSAPLSRLDRFLDLNTSTGRIASIAGIRAEQVPSGLSGAQLCRNPDFLNGLDGYFVYNNSGGSHVQLFHETDASAPNTSGKRMRVNVSGATTSPGRGGFTILLYPTDGPVLPGYYRRGAEVMFTIRAWIPAGATIDFASNSTGAETTHTWLTPQSGTSAWQTYVFRLRIGTTGSFSSTGYFWLNHSSATFDWYVAMVDAVDVSAQPTTFAGAGLRSATGARLADADIVTSQGTAADTSTVGGRASSAVRDEAISGSEGRRRVDTLWDGDGNLRPNLNIHDPGVAWRNLTDVGRRTQVGLTWADTAGNGAEIAKNAPLARVAAVLPGIDPGTGRVNRSATASDGSTLESTVGADNKVRQLRNLVNNPSTSGNLERWTNPGGLEIVTGSGAPFTAGQSFWVHRLYSAGPGDDKITFSDWFEVDPGKAYEVTWYQAATVYSGNDYFGLHTRDAGGGDPGITEIDLDGNVHSWTNTNPYWWWGQNGGDRYYKHTGYILPAGTPLDRAVGLGENVYRVFRFNPTTKWVQLRYLNYYNSQAKYLYTGHIRVVEVTPEALEARRRIDTLYRGDRQLQPGVMQHDGAREVKLAQFAQYGSTQDGNAVTFSPPFQNVPVVQFGPGQVTYDPAMGNVRQRGVAEAVGLTPSGFTARIKIRQADPVLGTNTLSPSGGICTKLTATEAYDDVYTFNYSTTIYSYTESGGDLR
ncbi:MAG TPA: hypothetical protein VF263_08795, partial [Longimicrobiaceae bacterium]